MKQEVKQEVTFESFGLRESLMLALEDAGFKTPSPIQQEVIPLILSGKDLVGQAQTGTGKTAAFGLPALHNLKGRLGVEILVITPTRELATQVSDELFRLGKHQKVKTAIICGGKSFTAQIDAIRNGAQIVVATPGRLLDLLESNRLGQFNPSIVILDEADEMLNMGFLEDVQKIFTFLPEKRQTLLFSATMPGPIQTLAKRILNNPVFVSVTPKETTNQDIHQVYYLIHEEERDEALIRLLDSDTPVKSIIFCRTKKDVDRLTTVLVARGYLAKGLHGDMEQPQREAVIRSFRSPQVNTLVATDVAARGLSVPDISHVFNYHLPFDSASYVHRIGRTGRAGQKGLACTLITGKEYHEFQRFGKQIGTEMKQEFIPTLQEVKKKQMTSLLDKVQNQSIHKDALDILKATSDAEMKTMASKLLSLLLDHQGTTGPDQIGLDHKRIERLQSERTFNQRNKTVTSKKFFKKEHMSRARR